MDKIFEIKAMLLNKQMELIKDQPSSLKGRAREALIQDFLTPFLPGTLGIDGGAIISSNGDSSGELDIIIYDKNSYDLFKPFADFMPKKSKPFPSEVVFATIEVENKLEEKRLAELAEKIRKVKTLPKRAYYEQTGPIKNKVRMYGKELDHFPILGIIFAYDSSELEKLLKILSEINSNIPIENQIDMICVLNKGIIMHFDPIKQQLSMPFKTDFQLVRTSGTPTENLKLFYLSLMTILTQVWVKPINVLEYYRDDADETKQA